MMPFLIEEVIKCSYLLSKSNFDEYARFIKNNYKDDSERFINLSKKILDIYNQSINEELAFETLLDNKMNIQKQETISSLKSIIKPIKKYLVLDKIQNDDNAFESFADKYFENEPGPYLNIYSLLNENCIYFKNLDTTWKQVKESWSSSDTSRNEIANLLKKSVNDHEKHNIYFKLTQYYISLYQMSKSYNINTQFDKKEVLNDIYKAMSMNDKILETYARNLLLMIEPSNKLYYKCKKDFFSLLNELQDEHIQHFGTALINYCTIKLNKGIKSFNTEAYHLYHELHTNGILFSKIFFQKVFLDLYINTLININKSSYAQEILDKYIDLIPKSSRILQWSYNKSAILFSQKEYVTCINIVDNIEEQNLKDYYYKLKNILLKSLIETNQYDRATVEYKNIKKHIKDDKM